MIRLLYAVPGAGKTACMCAMGQEDMYGPNARRAIMLANADVARLNENGFNVTPPSTKHLVYGYKIIIDVKSANFGHRRSLRLDGSKVGIASKNFKPQNVYRGSTLLIDEIHRLADARNWAQFAENYLRFFEEHRKYDLTIIGTCQDPSQVEKRIRQLACITRVVEKKTAYNKFGQIKQCAWVLHNWASYEDWAAGSAPEIEEYVYDGNIARAYDTYEGAEGFYAGLIDGDFDATEAAYTSITPTSVENYMKEHPLKMVKE